MDVYITVTKTDQHIYSVNERDIANKKPISNLPPPVIVKTTHRFGNFIPNQLN